MRQDWARLLPLYLVTYQAVGFSRFVAETAPLLSLGDLSSSAVRIFLLTAAGIGVVAQGRVRLHSSVALVGFVLVALLSTAWSVAPQQTLADAALLLVTAFLFTAISNSFKADELLSALRNCLTSAVTLGLLAYAFRLPSAETFDFYTVNIIARNGISGLFEHNVFAGVLCAINIILIIYNPFRTFLITLSALIISFVFIILSDSLSAYLLTAFTALMMVYFGAKPGRHDQRLRIVALIVAGIAFLAVAANITLVATALGRSADLTGRAPLWQSALALAGERPYLGWGYGSIFGPDGAIARLGLSVGRGNWAAPHFHNDALQLLVELGPLGLGGFIAMQIRLYLAPTVATLTPSHLACVQIIATLLLIYSLVGEIFTAQKFGWLFLLLALAQITSAHRGTPQGSLGARMRQA